MATGDITYFRYKRHDYQEQEVSPRDMDLPAHHSHYSYLQEITEMTTKHELLDLAKAATADRGLNYGKPEDNFERIARRWRVHILNRFDIDVPIDAASVALMCDDIKTARLENDITHKDSWVDKAGYAACGAEIVSAMQRPTAPRVSTREWVKQQHDALEAWPDSVDSA
jgi:hypothetical protein